MENNNNKMKKAVSFNLNRNQTKILCVYTYAMHHSRSGLFWIQLSIDGDRFRRRIKETDNILTQVLNHNHRLKIYKERFENKYDDFKF